MVLATVESIPDLLRVEAVEDGRLLLRADADPQIGRWVERAAVIAIADLPRRRVLPGLRVLRRIAIDVREAWLGHAEAADGTDVQSKYETQAPFYAVAGATAAPDLLARATSAFLPAGRVLVAGSGVGTECFALAACGFEVSGLDFAPAMIAEARAEAERRHLSIHFVEADLLAHREPPGSLAGIFFTYDVYSFLADPEERVELLRRMGTWLAPDAGMLLAARRAVGGWRRLVLTVQWLACGARRPWGASHTRWISTRGQVHRSFVQVFPWRVLRNEWRAAGLREENWEAGHGLLKVANSPRVSG